MRVRFFCFLLLPRPLSSFYCEIATTPPNFFPFGLALLARSPIRTRMRRLLPTYSFSSFSFSFSFSPSTSSVPRLFSSSSPKSFSLLASKMSSQQKIAIVSVYDKTGLLDLAKGLVQQNVRILASGGTSKMIRESGFPVEYVNSILCFMRQ